VRYLDVLPRTAKAYERVASKPDVNGTYHIGGLNLERVIVKAMLRVVQVDGTLNIKSIDEEGEKIITKLLEG
jgi:hypothetical protein